MFPSKSNLIMPSMLAIIRTTLFGMVFVCLVCIAVSKQAIAAGTHTLSIGATVLSKNNCRFTNAGPTVLDFGAIDPSSGVDKTATASMTYRCTGSNPMATYIVTSNDGLYSTGANAPRMRHGINLATYVPYAINVPQSGTVARNVDQTLTVTGTVLVADFQNALVGAYSDTVVLTISP